MVGIKAVIAVGVWVDIGVTIAVGIVVARANRDQIPAACIGYLHNTLHRRSKLQFPAHRGYSL
jgi:hypothetical protein